MKLKKITLENFGLFRGVNEIDLDTRSKYGKVKPLVLIGGKNGAGKTTLLESLRLCLYGARALGDRVSVREYERYLRGRIHRDDSAPINPTSASVGLVFTHSELGQKHEYNVTRSWEKRGNSIATFLNVCRDGEPLDEIDQENADEFLRDLIPPGVSQLYFFDGEKIQQLAEADDEDVALSDAIRNLLGLELIDRLQSDLKIYSTRMAAKDSNSAASSKLEVLTSEIEAKKESIIQAQREFDVAVSAVDSIKKAISREESRLAKEGGLYASKREAIEGNRRDHAARVSELENQIRRCAEDLLPFAIVPKLCAALKAQVENDLKIQQQKIIDDVVQTKVLNCQREIKTHLEPYKSELTPATRDNLTRDLCELVQHLFVVSNQLTGEVIHNFSDSQRARVLAAIDRIESEVPSSLRQLRNSLEQEIRLLQKAERDLKKVPSEDQLKPIVHSINDLNRQLGSKQADVNQKQSALNSLIHSLREIERHANKLEATVKKAGKLQQKQVLTSQVQSILEVFREKLLRAKADELGHALKTRFGQLWRKGDRASRIEIDSNSFEVALYDRLDREVPRRELSAGEKQMYAISILWALADVSGRPLPIVIDTPLGRLDAGHRSHLVEKYFPHASHQVIILSTDTEIDQEFFSGLQPAMSHAIRLTYDHDEVCTVIEDGYFWKRNRNQPEPANAT